MTTESTVDQSDLTEDEARNMLDASKAMFAAGFDAMPEGTTNGRRLAIASAVSLARAVVTLIDNESKQLEQFDRLTAIARAMVEHQAAALDCRDVLKAGAEAAEQGKATLRTRTEVDSSVAEHLVHQVPTHVLIELDPADVKNIADTMGDTERTKRLPDGFNGFLNAFLRAFDALNATNVLPRHAALLFLELLLANAVAWWTSEGDEDQCLHDAMDNVHMLGHMAIERVKESMAQGRAEQAAQYAAQGVNAPSTSTPQ